MHQENRNLLLKNFFSLGFLQVVNSLLQLVVIPYVIARIGIENYGVVAVAQVIMFYLSTFAEYGFAQTGTREVSLNRTDKNILSFIFARTLFTKAFLWCAAFVLFLLLALVFPFIRNHFMLYCMAFIFIPGTGLLPGWFFQGLEKMKAFAVASLFSRVLFVVLVFLFIRDQNDSSLYIFFLGLGSMVSGIISTWLLFRYEGLSVVKVSWKDIAAALKDGWHITGSNLSMNIIQYGNIFILRLFANDLVTGYYGVVERIFFSLKQVLTVFAQSVYPRVCQLAEATAGKLLHFFKRVFSPFLLLVVILSACVALTASYIVHFFIGEVNRDAVFILQLFCIVLPIVCLNIPGSLSLLAFGRNRIYFAIHSIAALLCIIANVLLAKVYGPFGTLGTIFVTEIFITVSVSLAMKKLLKVNTG